MPRVQQVLILFCCLVAFTISAASAQGTFQVRPYQCNFGTPFLTASTVGTPHGAGVLINVTPSPNFDDVAGATFDNVPSRNYRNTMFNCLIRPAGAMDTFTGPFVVVFGHLASDPDQEYVGFQALINGYFNGKQAGNFQSWRVENSQLLDFFTLAPYPMPPGYVIDNVRLLCFGGDPVTLSFTVAKLRLGNYIPEFVSATFDCNPLAVKVITSSALSASPVSKDFRITAAHVSRIRSAFAKKK